MSKFPEAIPPLSLDPARTAFFLDFDGTLSQIVSDPRRAKISAAMYNVLTALAGRSQGAVAVVSGRSLAQLDTMLHPLHLALAGVHGIERRGTDGAIHKAAYDGEEFTKCVAEVEGFSRLHEGTLAEMKPGSVALHYRNRPELEAQCLGMVEALARSVSGTRLLRGKMVIELTFAPATKGTAIKQFMNEAPFIGRTPFFAGDDVTDEAGFAVVNALGGVTVKIGDGVSAAKFRLAGVSEFGAYLETLLVPSLGNIARPLIVPQHRLAKSRQ